MVNKDAVKLVVTGDNYQKFIDENIIDGTLDFSVVVPIPNQYKDGHKKKLIYALRETDNLYLQFQSHDKGFYFTPKTGHLSMVTDFSYPNSFYYWSLQNWSTPSIKPTVSIEYIENGAIIRFLTLECGPIMWGFNLVNVYPDLNFKLYSLGARGHYTLITIEDGETCYKESSANLSPQDFYKLDCTLNTDSCEKLIESLS
jgi:hypothetical protein